MDCRTGCAACCIAPSISSPIPGMQNGKPAGTRCVQLTDDNLCSLFGSYLRPSVCGNLKPHTDMCGNSSREAMETLAQWECITRPDSN